MNNPTDEQLSRAVAEKLGKQFAYEKWEGGRIEHLYLDYASPNAWPLIGPEIEKRYGDALFRVALRKYRVNGDETLPRAACLAILEE